MWSRRPSTDTRPLEARKPTVFVVSRRFIDKDCSENFLGFKIRGIDSDRAYIEVQFFGVREVPTHVGGWHLCQTLSLLRFPTEPRRKETRASFSTSSFTTEYSSCPTGRKIPVRGLMSAPPDSSPDSMATQCSSDWDVSSKVIKHRSKSPSQAKGRVLTSSARPR